MHPSLPPPQLVAVLASATSPRRRRGPLQPVALRAEVSSEVAHDRMHVTLYSEAQHSDPAELAVQTTRALNRALQTARQNKDVIVSRKQPQQLSGLRRQGQQITGWRDAELRASKAAISPACRN